MLEGVQNRWRVLNTHYQQPPELNTVELMSSGKTDESLIDALMEKIPQYSLKPFRVRGGLELGHKLRVDRLGSTDARDEWKLVQFCKFRREAPLLGAWRREA